MVLLERGGAQEGDGLHAIVDMGSNGIRFSISDLSAPTARLLPTVHQYRLDISLYDAQFDPENDTRVPIPEEVIDSVVAALLRFQVICSDFGIGNNRIRVIATEASRTAINGDHLVDRIEKETGLKVDILPSHEEGRVGALGVASGFSGIRGIAMDLGGGSTQITWIISQGGSVRMSPRGSFSFPYGAAALSRQLKELTKGKNEDEIKKAKEELRQTIREKYVNAYDNLQVPKELEEVAARENGYDLYLSGGGFRGWGYMLLFLNQVHGHHYPISIINGYSAQREAFEDTNAVEEIAHSAHKIFRISDRRREQAPAVAFLIQAMCKALPHGIRRVHFCQGGVREGLLFRELTPRIRRQDPLEIATSLFARPSADAMYDLLFASIPAPSERLTKKFPETFNEHVLRGYINVLFVHATMSKESSSTAAMYSTSTGLMSATHGVSHEDRARLALTLEERYEGELPPREDAFKSALRTLLTAEEVWWTRYLGKIGLLLGRLYPAGEINESKPRVLFSSAWAENLKTEGETGLKLTLTIQKVKKDPLKLKQALKDHVGTIEKVGKPKNWIGGADGWGMAVKVDVVEEDIL